MPTYTPLCACVARPPARGDRGMTGIPPLPPSAIPLMSPERARDIARGHKWLHQQYDETGMPREAARALRDSELWLGYALALANTRQNDQGEAQP
jgi:hypothetical protein